MALQAVQEACLLGSVMSDSIKEQREPNWLFRNYLCQPYLEIWAHQPCSSFVCGVFGGCMRSKVIKARCCVVDNQQIDLDELIICIAKSISNNWQPRSSSLTGHICVYGVTLSWWQLGSIPPLCSVSSTVWSNCVLSALSLPSLCSHWVVGLVWLPHLEAVNVAVVASSTGAHVYHIVHPAEWGCCLSRSTVTIVDRCSVCNPVLSAGYSSAAIRLQLTLLWMKKSYATSCHWRNMSDSVTLWST